MTSTSRGLFATDCEVAAARWVQRKLGDCHHERRVLAIASKLFDLTRPHLGLGMAECRMLRLAALTHDVGRCVSEKNHPEEGAKLILATTAMELSPFDRRALAFLTYHHRGAIPEPMREQHLRPLDPRRPLRMVLALLRVADAMDSRVVASPDLLISISGRKLAVRCFVDDANYRDARRVYRRRKKKFELLETYLGAAIDVSVERTPRYAMAG